MRTIVANVNALAHMQAAGTRHSDFGSVTSLLNAINAWYVAAIGKAQLVKLSSRLLVDILGENAPRHVESHVRDGFGRPIY